jgi:hypothetical protein
MAATLIEAYYDESDSTSEPQKPQVLCVGGYFFESDDARLFQAEWIPLLDEYGLTHFSMADCNSQWKEFERYSDDECIVIQTRFFEVLKKHAKAGFTASMELRHRDLLPSSLSHGISIISPYTLCCFWCLEYARIWAPKNSFSGEFAYFFENGYTDEWEATKVIKGMFCDPWVCKKYLHASDTFASKKKVPLLQAADILAWQWRKDVVARLMGNLKTRRDLMSLLDIPTETIHFNEHSIQEFIKVVIRGSRLRREAKNASSGDSSPDRSS